MDNSLVSTTPANTGYTAAIFDLGDVLLTWSPSSTLSHVSPKTLRNILRSVHWFEYEKGNLTEGDVYTAVASEFGVAAVDVKEALEAARSSLQSNPKIIEVICELKKAGLSIYAMSNISAPDWVAASSTLPKESWDLFDHIFTS